MKFNIWAAIIVFWLGWWFSGWIFETDPNRLYAWAHGVTPVVRHDLPRWYWWPLK